MPFDAQNAITSELKYKYVNHLIPMHFSWFRLKLPPPTALISMVARKQCRNRIVWPGKPKKRYWSVNYTFFLIPLLELECLRRLRKSTDECFPIPFLLSKPQCSWYVLINNKVESLNSRNPINNTHRVPFFFTSCPLPQVPQFSWPLESIESNKT